MSGDSFEPSLLVSGQNYYMLMLSYILILEIKNTLLIYVYTYMINVEFAWLHPLFTYF